MIVFLDIKYALHISISFIQTCFGNEVCRGLKHCKPKKTSDYTDEDKLDILEDHNSISYRILLLWITFSKHVKSLSYRMNKKLHETLCTVIFRKLL